MAKHCVLLSKPGMMFARLQGKNNFIPEGVVMKKVGMSLISGFMVSIICGFVILSIVNFHYRSSYVLGAAIAADVQKLGKAFEKINRECSILKFAQQQTPITFLNVESFTGSELGGMNLALPENWQGPYLPLNPEVQNIEYMVVRTDEGYFVTPGNGVTLPNGKEIGTDIILDQKANIGKMMYDKDALYFNRKPLAYVLPRLGMRPKFPEGWRFEG